MIVNDSMTEDELIKIISKHWAEIRFLKNPSEKVQLAAVKTNGYSIYHIKYPSEKVQLEAIKQCPKILNRIKGYINNPCQKVLDMLMIKDIIE